MTAVLGVDLPGMDPGISSEVLSDLDRRMLAFFDRPGRPAGVVEQEIRVEFAVSPTAFFQRLNRLIDTQAALAASPLVVNRLRRLREAGTRRWLL